MCLLCNTWQSSILRCTQAAMVACFQKIGSSSKTLGEGSLGSRDQTFGPYKLYFTFLKSFYMFILHMTLPKLYKIQGRILGQFSQFPDTKVSLCCFGSNLFNWLCYMNIRLETSILQLFNMGGLLTMSLNFRVLHFPF